MKSRTTLILSQELMRELKRRAASRGETLSAVVEETLLRGLGATSGAQAGDVAPLPVHPMGRPRVDVADRDRLYAAMGEG